MTWRTTNPLFEEANNDVMREEVDVFEEKKLKVALTSVIVQQTIIAIYNRHKKHMKFRLGDLVLRRADVGGKNFID